MATILCDLTDCIYRVFVDKNRTVYKNQCDNDKIEIRRNEQGVPQCYCYSKETKIKKED